MKRKHSYRNMALLLAGMLTLGAGIGALGQSQARVTSVAGWQMQLQQPEEEVQLVSRVMDDKGTWVRLQDLYADDVRRVVIDMEVIGGTANGTLYCTPNTELLYATCLETIDDESEQEFTILLTPTEEAELLTEPVDVSVYVEWNSKLYTTLKVRLLPVQTDDTDNPEVLPASETQQEQPEGEEAGEEEEIPEQVDSFLTGMTDFAPWGRLALEIQVPEGCDQLRLSRDYEPFPAFTRYSTDGGERYTLLYDGGVIEIDPGREEKIQLLLDFRDVNVGSEPLIIAAEASGDGQILGTDFLTTEPTARIPEAEEAENPIILTADRTWSTQLPEGLNDTQALYYMRRADGTEDNLATLYRDGTTLTISAADKDFLAPAGTYFLDITWDYQGMTVAERHITFYINYSAYVQPDDAADSQPTGGNES